MTDDQSATGSGDDEPPGVGRPDLEAVTLGGRPPDLVVTGGRVLLPDGTLRDRDVAVVGDRIAAVADPGAVTDRTPPAGPETGGAADAGDRPRVVDAGGRVVLPGLIDAHDHVDVAIPHEMAYHRRLERGTTAVVTETSSIGAADLDGVEEFLDATAGLPVTAYACVPPQPLADTFEPSAGPDAERRLGELLARDRVVGVGEVDWVHVVGRETPALDRLFDRARSEGGRVVGHGAGARGEKLRAFGVAVDNDHEPTTPEGVRERLAAGIHVVGRRGSVRDDLDALAAVDHPRGDVSLCTDGDWPGDDAGMDDVLRAAVDRGIDPVAAVEMATRTPAEHFGLADRGTISPGNRADLVVVEDLSSFAVGTVVAGGRVVVEDGSATVGPRPHDYPPKFHGGVSLGAGGSGESAASDGTTGGGVDLRVPVAAGRDGAVRAIARHEGLVTRSAVVEPPVEDGAFVAAPDEDLLKAAIVDRRAGRDGSFVGFVTGVGLDCGAAATTLTWELPALAVVGASDRAMRRAVDRVAEMGGGWAVVGPGDDGSTAGGGTAGQAPTVLADNPMPIAGVAAEDPPGTVADRYEAVGEALVDLGGAPDPGVPRANDGDPGPMLAIQTLSFPGVPVLRLSFSGYAHVIDRQVVGLDPGEGS